MLGRTEFGIVQSEMVINVYASVRIKCFASILLLCLLWRLLGMVILKDNFLLPLVKHRNVVKT